jgi:hypothetical protein
LLSLLSSRLLDKDSYVRQRTLHTWAALVPTPVVPLPMWNVLLNLGEGLQWRAMYIRTMCANA